DGARGQAVYFVSYGVTVFGYYKKNPVFIGYLLPDDSKMVMRNGKKVPLAKIEQETAEFWWWATGDWNAFFAEHEVTDESLAGQGVQWRREVGYADFKNDSAVAVSKAKDLVWEVGMHYAAAPFAVAKIVGTGGLTHSFDTHAAEWFGRAVAAGQDLPAWTAMI